MGRAEDLFHAPEKHGTIIIEEKDFTVKYYTNENLQMISNSPVVITLASLEKRLKLCTKSKRTRISKVIEKSTQRSRGILFFEIKG